MPGAIGEMLAAMRTLLLVAILVGCGKSVDSGSGKLADLEAKVAKLEARIVAVEPAKSTLGHVRLPWYCAITARDSRCYSDLTQCLQGARSGWGTCAEYYLAWCAPNGACYTDAMTCSAAAGTPNDPRSCQSRVAQGTE